MTDSYFITGAQGCIGAWVVKLLVDRGDDAVVFDRSTDAGRLHAILDDEHLQKVRFVEGDITDLAAVRTALGDSGAGRVIHLAGLQVPFCRDDPTLGAMVNVVGTVNMFQAALECGIERIAYASSAAVYSWDGGSAVPDETDPCVPGTHYGVYKRANEGNALVFWSDNGLSSIGLRPLTVYGVGRDQGLTSDPTRAMKAAVLGRDFGIRFSGATDFQYVADTAATFIACTDRGPEGAHVFNIHGDSVEISTIVDMIRGNQHENEGGHISVTGDPLPIPPVIDGSRIQKILPDLPKTPLETGIRETMDHFRRLHSQGRLETHDLEI